MIRRGANRAATALGVVCLLLAVLGVGIASGHGFGLSADPDHYVADSSIHTWVSTETDPAYLNRMENVFDTRMTNQYGARTVLSVQKLPAYTTDVDAYWFSTASIGSEADATCMDLNTAPNPDQCRRARIRFRDGWVMEAILAQRKQGACHEIGHTVGFDDSVPENNIGCMSNGPNGVLSDHEIGHINAQWGGGP